MLAKKAREKGGKTIKALFLIDGLGLGGAERMMLPILTRLNQIGVETRVCALYIRNRNPIQKQIEAAGISVDVLGINRLKTPSNLPRLARYLRRAKPDVLHTQLEFSNTLGSIAGKLAGIPTLTTLHTYDNPAPGSRAESRLKWMWRSLRYCSDQIIGVSNGTSQHHLHRGKFDPNKVITIYNGLDLGRFAPISPAQKRAKRVEFNLPVEGFLLITVAVLRQPKGIQHMIDAMPATLQQLPHAHYLVVGGGEYGAPLQTQAHELGLSDKITFIGVRQDVPALLPMADLFLHPTLDDALPTVLIEAMATQLPIVASAVGGVPEMVFDGENGCLTTPAQPNELADAILRIGNDPALAKKMGQAGKRIAEEKFSIERQADQLAAVYRKLAKQ